LKDNMDAPTIADSGCAPMFGIQAVDAARPL
jgi:hypothetical protein